MDLHLYFFIVFASVFGIQILFVVFIYGKLAFYKNENKINEKKPVSIIVCAKNEAENLDKNLEYLLTQAYPEYEVIVVNDCSEDNTPYILKKYKEKYSHLEIVTNALEERFARGKKLPLTLGLKRAKHEWVLLTDADCRPHGNYWLTTMQNNFIKNIGIVLGYGRYKRNKGLLNLLIRLDSFLIAVRYMGFVLNNCAYMGVGRNLAYRKKLFFDNKGFASHYHILSGDDDLLISEIAPKTQTTIEFKQESQTESEPEKTLKKWIKQKKRHLTTGKYYKPKVKFWLGLFSVSELLFYILLAVLLFLQYNLFILASMFGFRYLLQILFLLIIKNKFKEKWLYLLLMPIFEIFYLIFYGLVVCINTFYKNKAWN